MIELPVSESVPVKGPHLAICYDGPMVLYFDRKRAGWISFGAIPEPPYEGYKALSVGGVIGNFKTLESAQAFLIEQMDMDPDARP